MNDTLNKYGSEDNMSLGADDTTPPNFITERRPRAMDQVHLTTTEDFNSFKEEMRQLMTYFTASQKEQLQSINSNLKDITQTNRNIENSITHLFEQNEEFKKIIVQLENRAKEDKDYICLLENKIEEMQIGSRKGSFEMKNVPKKVNETKNDLVEMVTSLSESVQCQLNKNDIKDIYRVRGKNPSQLNSSIVVETNSALLKNDLLRAAKTFNRKSKSKLCAKHLGLKTSEDTPVYMSEHLTARGSRLHFLARDLAKSKDYKFCWTSYGKVYVRKDEQSKPILINSEEQVHSLMTRI